MAADPSFVVAMTFLCAGGFIDGSLGLGLKYTKAWSWEHLWLTYTLLAFGIIPWIFGLSTVSNLLQLLGSADRSIIGVVFLCGLLWGCGAVLYGLALKHAGMALTYAIVMGLTAAIGSLLPLVLLHAKSIFTLRGQITIGAVFLVVVGVSLCAWAGRLKEMALATGSPHKAVSIGQKPMLGVVLAIIAGVLSPLINLSFAFGTPLSEVAVAQGTNPLLAPNVIWVVALSAGGIVNVAYCTFLISRNRSWQVMRHSSRDYLLGLVMGLLGPASLIMYGMGTTKLGVFGPVIGWPMMSSMGIVGANFWGMITGEWRGVGKAPMLTMYFALVVLILAMFALGWVETLE